jgi:UDP-glucose 4-epimerase
VAQVTAEAGRRRIVRAVVTGGRGFIGSHLVDALVERGDNVAVIDNGSSGDNENPGARYYNEDLSRPTRFGFKDVDVLFHCAAVGRTPAAIADPVNCWETNLMASVRLLDTARHANVKRVVFSSSNIVYAAETPYKASKLAMEHAARVYAELYGLSTISLRYANTYGSRQREDGIGPNVFASLRKSLRHMGYIEVTGDGEQTRDYIHVSDVVRANLMAAESDCTGELDICTGVDTSLNQIAKLIGADVSYVAEREGDIKHIRQNSTRALLELGFASEVKLEDGIWDSFPTLKVAA